MTYWERVQNSYSPEGVFLIALPLVLIAYLWFLRRIRPAPVEPPAKEGFSEVELDRYARHIVLRELGGQGQARLAKSRVLVVGAGGLGSPVLQYLAAAGVGTIGVIDDDTVSLSNLQRQVLFDEDVLGQPKVFAAQKRMRALNPHVEVLPYARQLDANNAADLIAEFDLVVDGCDSFATRSLVNAACVAASVPLVSGAISQWDGQVSLFDPAQGTPCYACIFDKEPDAGAAPSCAEGGVLGALPGVIGSMMAVETVKYLAKAGQPLQGRMMIYDALYASVRTVKIAKRDGCAVCGSPKE